jgi:hypothetical protein
MGKTRDDFNQKKRTIIEHITTNSNSRNNTRPIETSVKPIQLAEKRISDRKEKLSKCEKRQMKLLEQVDEAAAKLAEAEELVE